MQKYSMAVHYQTLGGHTHIEIRTGKLLCQLGKAGDLTMTNEEFEAWRKDEINVEWLPIRPKQADVTQEEIDQFNAAQGEYAKPIRIVMDQGLIQEIHNIPPSVTVEVYDYDVERCDDHPNIQKDEQGKSAFVNLWTSGGQLQ